MAFRIWITFFCSQCFVFCWKNNEDFDVFTKGNIPRILESVNLLMPGNDLATCWKCDKDDCSNVSMHFKWLCILKISRHVLEETTGSLSGSNVHPGLFKAGLSCYTYKYKEQRQVNISTHLHSFISSKLQIGWEWIKARTPSRFQVMSLAWTLALLPPNISFSLHQEKTSTLLTLSLSSPGPPAVFH